MLIKFHFSRYAGAKNLSINCIIIPNEGSYSDVNFIGFDRAFHALLVKRDNTALIR